MFFRSMLQFIQSLALLALQPAAEAAKQAANAAEPLADAVGDQPPQPMTPFYLMIGMTMLMFWFLIIAPERKRAKQKQKLIDNLKKNDRVLTAGGIYAIVSNVKPGEDELVLKIDEDKDVKIRVTKSSIAAVLSSKEESE